MGFILRTAAEGIGEQEVLADIMFLRRLWASIQETIRESKSPAVIYEDLSLQLRTMRDLVNPDIEKIRIDCSGNLSQGTQICQKAGASG